jgi:HAE1 family hydrophobic/amphiphilic exporter-1
MTKILKFIFDRPVTTSMIFLMILILGILSLFKVPIELNPNVELQRVYITTVWYGTSAETIESYITTQIESAAATIKGVKNISSTTETGSSRVIVEFGKYADFKYSVLELSEKVSRVAESFPTNVVPIINKTAPREVMDRRFMTYSVSAQLEEMTIKKILQDKVRPVLLSIHGVSDVKVQGGLDRQIKILVDENKLHQYGISFDLIMTKLNNFDYIQNCGELTNSLTSAPVLIYDNVESMSDIANIVLTNINGNLIRLSDVASIMNTMEDRNVFNRINGEPKITLEIVKEAGENIITTADEVIRRIGIISETIPEVKFKKEYDESDRLRVELKKLFEQASVALVGVFITLIVFIRNIRAPIIILFEIFFSIIVVILIFSFFNVTLNILSISGLALGIGILVDNAIVVYENIVFHKGSDNDYCNSIINALAEVGKPLLGSTLTTSIVFIPFFFLPDDLKGMFFNFGIGMALAIIVSLFFALTFIPFVVKYLDKKERVYLRDEQPIILPIYEKTLRFAIKRKKIIVILCLLFLGLPLWLLPDNVESGFFKNFYNNTFNSNFYKNHKELIHKITGGSWYLFKVYVGKGDITNYGREDDRLMVGLTMEDGTDINVLNDITSKIEKQLDKYMEYIQNYSTFLQDNTGELNIYFNDEFKYSSFPYLLKAELISYFAEFGGLHATVNGYGDAYYAGSSFYSSSNFSVRVLGYKYNKVKDIALELKEKLEENRRIENVDINSSWFRSNAYEIVAKVDRKKVAMLGLNVNDVLYVIRAHTGGMVSYKYVSLDDEKIAMNLKFKDYDEYQMYDLMNQQIRDKVGNVFLIKDLVDISREKTLGTITRYKQQYSRNVSFQYNGRPEYGMDYVKSVVNSIALPYGFHIETGYGGMLSSRSEIAFLKILFVSLFLIYIISASLFESFKKPIIILSVIPMAMIGVFLIYYLSGYRFGTGAYAGLALLFGISVNNSIILVDYISRLQNAGISLDEAIVEGTKRRTKPIIMTTITTVIGLLPFIIIGDPSLIWHGMALTVIGGILSSTFIVLIVLPSIYRIFYKS